MIEEQGTARSQLFVLRMWEEEVTADRIEVRGLVRHVLSGESTYFHDWSTLASFLDQWVTLEVNDRPRSSPA